MIFSFGSNPLIMKLETGEGYVEFISVEPNCRGKGIGQILLQAADEECRKRNCHVSKIFRIENAILNIRNNLFQKVSLNVILSNFGARRLYERLGYIATKLYTGRRCFLMGQTV